MSAPLRELPAGYYLQNFETLLAFVGQQYPDLLTPDERQFLSTFRSLSEDARKLYVRLVLRKGPLFRADKLNYPEIADLPAAARELQTNGLLGDGQGASVEMLAELLIKGELARLCAASASQRREVLVGILADRFTAQTLRHQLPFEIYEPLCTDCVLIFRLLFFGNLRQDFSDFVLNDLGIMQYESYVIDAETRFFDARETVEQLILLQQLNDQLQSEDIRADPDALTALAEQLPAGLARGVERRGARLVNGIARQLERLGCTQAAEDLYRRTARGDARERLIRILATTVDGAPEALNLCEQIAIAPETEAELTFAVSFARRLCRKYHFDLPPLLSSPGSESPQTLLLKLEQVPGERVERCVADWFEQQQCEAFYAENWLFTGIFGLAFWDIIFAPVPGVFFNPFQLGPTDLFSADFHQDRAALISERLTEISHADVLTERVLKQYDRSMGLANHFVHWGIVSEALLSKALQRIPVTHFQAIFRRLLRDLRHNRSGFPDLVIFPAQGGYELIEVKGPGDKLQQNQLRWFSHFQAHQIPARVALVEWRES
ncbi:MAG: VRR-NUC domain-containing protein [Pseudomonadales bacterium]|nr:VRR-NUC domain-containing protein [Pseudomonadales bacterium]